MAGDFIGKVFSHYRIESKLGEGGMGTVYRARDLELNRSAAIKVLSSRVAGEEQRRRFQQEALTASSLNHPHILTVYEAGSAESCDYLITEFIEGWTLREWVDRERPSLRQVIELAGDIADAMACAHAAGIVHRDIKPANILVSRHGYAKLVDFGLAKLLDKQATEHEQTRTMDAVATRPGIVVGTIPYMSPEQISGRPTDPRSDIFSFGAVLYEILAGQRPFLGKSDSELLLSILHSTPRPISEIRPDVPYSLRAILDKALEKDPADRYQYALEMAVDLRRSQRASSVAEPVVIVRRRPRLLLLLGGAILLLLVIAGWSFYRSDLFWKNPLANARFTRITDFEDNEPEAAISSDGKFVVFLSDREGTFDAWVTQLGTGQFLNISRGRFSELLHEEVSSVGFSSDGSHVWMRSPQRVFTERSVASSVWLAPVLGVEPRVFLSKAIAMSTSPDGGQVVYHTSDPGDPIFVADRNGNNPRRIFGDKAGSHCHYPVWSRDGRFIYFVRGYPVTETDIWRIPVAGGEPERLTHHVGLVRYPTPFGSGTLLYTTTAEDGSGPWLYGLDVKRHVSHRLSLGFERYLSISAAADSRLVTTVASPTANLWTVPITERAVDENAAERYPLPTGRALAPRFAADGLLYLSSMGGADGIWKAQGKHVLELWKGSDGAVVDSPALSPDGGRICFAVRKQGRGWLRMMSIDGTDVRAIADDLQVTGAPSWSPDGKWIAVAGDAGKGRQLFKVPVDGGSPLLLVDKPSYNPSWSPDGGVILFSEMAQGAALPLRAITPEGKPVPLPEISLRTAGERYRFLPGGKQVAVLRGVFRNMNFWLLDLASGNMRQITKLKPGSLIRGFDISPDGKRIVFDRIRENARAVLIDLPR